MDRTHSLSDLFDDVLSKNKSEEQGRISNPSFDISTKICVKINLYAVRFHKKERASNFVMNLLDKGDMFNDFYKGFIDFCQDFSTSECVDYDAFSDDYSSDNYSFLPKDKMNKEWDNLFLLLQKNDEYISYSKHLDKIFETTLSIVEYETSSNLYYAIRFQKPNPLNLMYKGKKESHLYSNNAKTTRIKNNSIVIMDTHNIDCVVKVSKNSPNLPEFYVFNKTCFRSIFNYDEYLKTISFEFCKNLKLGFITLPFLGSGSILKNNLDCIIGKIECKYVYNALSKISNNDTYLNQIVQTSAKDLKLSLIKNCKANNQGKGEFSEDDFDNDFIKITPKNIKKVLNAIALKYKFNFFINKAVS